jgi:S1-C subfamily serine protease
MANGATIRRLSALGCICLAGATLSVALAGPGEPTRDAAADLAAVRADEAQRVAAIAQASPAVVCVLEDRECSGGGSGVLIDSEGDGLTNFHVIASMLESRSGYGGLPDGNLYPLRVIGLDPGGDIALFKLEGKDRFDCTALGDAEVLRVGQRVAAMGNPFMLAEDYSPTITLGVISGLHRYQKGQGNLLEYADCIQVSTSINPGNSGGPIIDLGGRVVAIAGRGSFEERGRVNVGIGYGVPVGQIRRFLPALRAGRLCYHGTLGATAELAGDDLIINAVQDGSPVAVAGIELGDELLRINGREVHTANEVTNAIAVLPAGWPVSLDLRRGGKPIAVRLRLEALPLRGMPLFVPDLRLNHAEIQRVFRSYEQAGRNAEPLQNGSAERASFRVRCQTGTGAMQDGWPTAAVHEEYEQIAAALLGARNLDVNWELLGGDEVGGQIVSVIEQRLPTGRHVRWKFAFDSHELLAATIVTALSLMLEGRALRAVLADGRSFPAQVERRDERRQLALLKIDAVNLPYFELADSSQLAVGDWLIAAANAFKVADGPEPVSVSVGVLSGRTNLSARLRAQDFPYDGPVLLADMIISTPGSPGGAVVDGEGRLVGMIGRTVISKRTNTWINYALPSEQLAAFLRGEEFQPRGSREGTASDPAQAPLALGIRLFDVGGRTRPAYVERVRPNSPAAWAGVHPDDLVLSVNGETVATCDELRQAFATAPPGVPLTLVVKRGQALHVCELVPDMERK